MNSLKLLVNALIIASVYFIIATVAIAALVPEYAVNIGLGVAILALLIYLILVYKEIGEEDFAIAILAFAGPAACALAGIIWWLMTLFGVWERLDRLLDG